MKNKPTFPVVFHKIIVDHYIQDVSILFFFSVVLALFFTTTLAETQVLDTREGEDITLKCRFMEQNGPRDEFFYNWARLTPPSKFDNVAVGSQQLNSNYR